MLEYLFNHLWALLGFMAAILFLDYYLAILCRRSYTSQTRIRYDAFNDRRAYQRGIHAGRVVASEFLQISIFYLLPYLLLWSVVHWMADDQEIGGLRTSVFIFYVALGSAIWPIVGGITRSLEQMWFFRRLQEPANVSGSITYSRSLLYDISCDRYLVQCGAAILIAALTMHPFFVGVALGNAHTLVGYLAVRRDLRRIANIETTTRKPVDTAGYSSWHSAVVWWVLFLAIVASYIWWNTRSV